MDHLISRLGLDIAKPIIMVNQFGIVIFINQAFESVFGWTTNDLINQPLLHIIPHTLQDAHNVGFSRFISTEQSTLLNKPINLHITTKKRGVMNTTHVICAVKETGGWVFGANIEIITT